MADVRTIICGSPQAKGKCALAAGHLRDALQERFPKDQAHLFSVISMDVAPCVGCNACLDGGRCVFEDDMDALIRVLDRTDELFVVCPVYFSGPPSQMKAVLDRLQPYFAGFDPNRPKRPARMLVVGDGGDPHGFAPLETIVRSALSVAGFRLEAVVPCIGKSPDDACRLSELLMGP